MSTRNVVHHNVARCELFSDHEHTLCGRRSADVRIGEHLDYRAERRCATCRRIARRAQLLTCANCVGDRQDRKGRQ